MKFKIFKLTFPISLTFSILALILMIIGTIYSSGINPMVTLAIISCILSIIFYILHYLLRVSKLEQDFPTKSEPDTWAELLYQESLRDGVDYTAMKNHLEKYYHFPKTKDISEK